MSETKELELLILIDIENGILERLDFTLTDLKNMLVEVFDSSTLERAIAFVAVNETNNYSTRLKVSKKFGGIPIILKIVPNNKNSADNAMVEYLVTNNDKFTDVVILTLDSGFKKRVLTECTNSNINCFAIHTESKISRNKKHRLVSITTDTKYNKKIHYYGKHNYCIYYK